MCYSANIEFSSTLIIDIIFNNYIKYKDLALSLWYTSYSNSVFNYLDSLCFMTYKRSILWRAKLCQKQSIKFEKDAIIVKFGNCNYIRLNQLPVSAARWQHGSQIFLATFIKRKIPELLMTQQPQMLQEK